MKICYIFDDMNLPFGLNLETIAVILFGVISGGWGLYTHFKSNKKKELSYSIVANNMLANVYEELPTLHKIKISVGDKSVKKIRFVLIRVQNTGNIPVEASDLEYPICFVSQELLRNNTLIGGYIADAVPQNQLAAVVPYNDIDQVGLSRFTINKGERVDVALLLADYDDEIRASAHIKGGQLKYIDLLNPVTPWWGKTGLVWIIIHLFLSVYLGLSLTVFLHINFFQGSIVIFSTLILTTIIIWGYTKLKNRRKI